MVDVSLEKVPVRSLQKIRALIIYWSESGNTEKVAKAIGRGMEKEGLKPTIKRVEEAKREELYDYDLICIGSPTHFCFPAKAVLEFCRGKLEEYRQRGLRMLQAPLLPGKYAAVFCTASGPHTGLDEAIPAEEWLRQFLEHLGFDVKAKWYVAGEFFTGTAVGDSPYNTKGRLEDIRGRPNAQDLAKVESDATELIRKLRLVLGAKGLQENPNY